VIRLHLNDYGRLRIFLLTYMLTYMIILNRLKDQFPSQYRKICCVCCMACLNSVCMHDCCLSVRNPVECLLVVIRQFCVVVVQSYIQYITQCDTAGLAQPRQMLLVL